MNVLDSSSIYWPSEASNAERSEVGELCSANSPPSAGDGAALEASPEAPNLRIFASFAITTGAQSCVGRGWLPSPDTEKTWSFKDKKNTYMQPVATMGRSSCF